MISCCWRWPYWYKKGRKFYSYMLKLNLYCISFIIYTPLFLLKFIIWKLLSLWTKLIYSRLMVQCFSELHLERKGIIDSRIFRSQKSIKTKHLFRRFIILINRNKIVDFWAIFITWISQYIGWSKSSRNCTISI